MDELHELEKWRFSLVATCWCWSTIYARPG